MNKSVTAIFALLTLAISLVFTQGCRKLAPGGVYNEDQVLYNADVTLLESYDLLHTFVKWEYDNRGAFNSIPGIKKAADAIRRDAPGWFASAQRLRDAYKADPSQQNKDALTTALKVIRQAMSEASAYMIANTGK